MHFLDFGAVRSWLSILFLLGLGGCSFSARTSDAPTLPEPITFSPSAGAVGTLITLSSVASLDLSSSLSVVIGGTPAIVLNNSTSAARILVMPGSTSGSLVLTTGAGSSTSSRVFAVTATGVPAAQQGAKLVGTGAVGSAHQGYSVALSADGNTALIGGSNDNSGTGAACVFTRSGSIWTQQGAKLGGTGALGSANQGNAVALSADGNTALLGGYLDNGNTGAAWIFTRSGSTWTQQGAKLVGTGAVGGAIQGYAIALSADGTTALIGGGNDNTNAGATWAFTP